MYVMGAQNQHLIKEIDFAINMADDFLATLQKAHLTERIVLSGNNARIQIDQSILLVFEDIKKTLSSLKYFYKSIDFYQGIETKYLKFFRLLNQNSNELTKYLARMFKNEQVAQRLGPLFNKGVRTLKKFVKTSNYTFRDLNNFIGDPNYKLKIINDLDVNEKIYSDLPRQGDLSKNSVLPPPQFTRLTFN